MGTVDTNTTASNKNKGGRRSGRKAPPRAGAQAVATPDTNSNDKAEASSDGDKGDGDTKPSGSKRTGIPTHIRKAGVFRRLSDRLDVAVHGKGNTNEEGKRTSTEMDGWVEHDDINDAKAKAAHGIKLLREAADLLEGLGADFNPLPKTRRRSTGRAKIEKGSVVRLKDKFRNPEKGYGDLLTEEEMDKLTVRDVRGQKLVLTTEDGGKLFLPKGNVELAAVRFPETDDDNDGGDE